MTDCRWAGSRQPRMLPQRHVDGCNIPGCAGCVPCPWDHCRFCGIRHVDDLDACGACITEARDHLADIVRMHAALPDEVAHRGVDSRAMQLLGPTADPEAWRHHAASHLAGRTVPVGSDAKDVDALRAWLEEADGDTHPLWVTGTWAMVYTDALDHEDDGRQITVASACAYLDRHLHTAARWASVPFEDMARALRQCASTMESVLHDGEQVDHGVPCMACGADLERTWGATPQRDGWRCPRCRQTSTEDQYRFAVKADYIARADWLTDADMTTRTGVTASTVRSWARARDDTPVVRKRLEAERVVYCVADVEQAKRERLDHTDGHAC